MDAVACTSRDATGAGSMASRAARLRLDAAARETEYAEYTESAETCRARALVSVRESESVARALGWSSRRDARGRDARVPRPGARFTKRRRTRRRAPPARFRARARPTNAESTAGIEIFESTRVRWPWLERRIVVFANLTKRVV